MAQALLLSAPGSSLPQRGTCPDESSDPQCTRRAGRGRAGAGCREPGRGPVLSGTLDPLRGGLCPGRHQRSARTGSRPETHRVLETAGHRRQPPGGWRQRRCRGRRPCRARRLYAAQHQHRARDRAVAVSEAWLQPGARPDAGRLPGKLAADHGGQRHPADQDRSRTHRVGEAEQDGLRLGRRRCDQPPVDGDAEGVRRHRGRARSLQGRGAGGG